LEGATGNVTGESVDLICKAEHIFDGNEYWCYLTDPKRCQMQSREERLFKGLSEVNYYEGVNYVGAGWKYCDPAEDDLMSNYIGELSICEPCGGKHKRGGKGNKDMGAVVGVSVAALIILALTCWGMLHRKNKKLATVHMEYNKEVRRLSVELQSMREHSIVNGIGLPEGQEDDMVRNQIVQAVSNQDARRESTQFGMGTIAAPVTPQEAVAVSKVGGNTGGFGNSPSGYVGVPSNQSISSTANSINNTINNAFAFDDDPAAEKICSNSMEIGGNGLLRRPSGAVTATAPVTDGFADFADFVGRGAAPKKKIGSESAKDAEITRLRQELEQFKAMMANGQGNNNNNLKDNGASTESKGGEEKEIDFFALARIDNNNEQKL